MVFKLIKLIISLCLISSSTAFGVNPAFSRAMTASRTSTARFGFMDDVQGFFKKFTQKASASHILIKGADGFAKCEQLKSQIGNDSTKFADLAAEFSSCPSKARGGALGQFGPGQMVKEFDKVVFNEDVGVVHGPVETQFGHHLILITERTE